MPTASTPSAGPAARRPRACSTSRRCATSPSPSSTPRSPACPTPVLRRRTRHVVTENERVLQTVRLLRDGRLPEIGPLLTASHASMRDDYEITVPEVDTAVDALLQAGALGARMTGGGFGGCVIGLIEASARRHALATPSSASIASTASPGRWCSPSSRAKARTASSRRRRPSALRRAVSPSTSRAPTRR